MLELIKHWHVDTWLGVFLITLETVGTWFEWRFRRRAVRVVGNVIKYHRYSKHLSYYISYEYQGVTRVAEYYRPGPIASYEPGDTLEILVDPRKLPDVKIPEGSHIRWSRSGNCIPADSNLVSMFDVAVFLLGLLLVVYGVPVSWFRK